MQESFGDEELVRHESEVTGVELKERRQSITPAEKERLDGFLAQRMERASRLKFDADKIGLREPAARSSAPPPGSVQLKLARQDAVALRIYTKDRYDDNPYITAQELQSIHAYAVTTFGSLAEAKRFFDRAAEDFILNAAREQYGPLLKMMVVKFRDGAERARNDLLEVLINLLLVQQGIRPAFLLQWVDYDEVYRQDIKELILRVINEFFAEGTFALKAIDQGLLVIDTLKLLWVKRLIDKYEKSEGGSERALGLALGYPAAGEIETQGQRTFAHIVTPDGGDVMSNVCDNAESVQRFRDLYERIRAIVARVLGIELKLNLTKG